MPRTPAQGPSVPPPEAFYRRDNEAEFRRIVSQQMALYLNQINELTLRLTAAEATIADHEARIAVLEP